MPQYVDGFVVPVPKKNLRAYQKMSKRASKVWLEYGAIDYREAVLDDGDTEFCLPFPKGIKSKPGETVVFAYITYKSRKDRDRINAKVMKDPRLACSPDMDPKKMPFDCSRMLYGGFKTIVGT